MEYSKMDNIGQLFLQNVAENPSEPALIDGPRSISHGQLAEASMAIALGLRDRGLQRGSTIAIRSHDPALLLASLFATSLTGSRWVYAHANLVGSSQLDVDLILDDAGPETAQLPGSTKLDTSWFQRPAGEGKGQPFPFPQDHRPNDVWMISQTSGTTGTPKLVGLSQSVMLGRFSANSQRFQWDGIRLASLFPASAPIFLTYALTALLHRGAVVTGCQPHEWRQQGVGLVLASPMQAQLVLSELQLSMKVPALQLSGGPETQTLVRKLLKSFDRVLAGYGSTEAFNALVNEKTLGANDEIITTTSLSPGVAVELVDEADVPVQKGQEGLVRIANSYLATGYLNAPEAQAATFRDGWFYPGDLGIWAASGELLITGRTNDQFNIGGKKLNAQVMDAVLLDVPGVCDAISFMMPGLDGSDGLRVFLSVAPEVDITTIISEARIALMRLGGLAAVPKRFLLADVLPRNANGKANRRACVAMVEQAKANRQKLREHTARS